MVFHKFARLPAELRQLIWNESLPAEDPPTIYIYSPLFVLSLLDPDGEDERYGNINLDDRQPLVQARMPTLVHVSAEARAAALKWARSLGMSLRLRVETQGHVLVRRFDPSRDALYVAREAWEHFLELPLGENEEVDAVFHSIRHLALPAFTAYYSISDIGTFVMPSLTGLETITAVWGTLPEMMASRSVPHTSKRPANGRVPYLIATTTTDDDGTDTGLDKKSRDEDFEIIEVLPAQVQPRWELEDEDDAMVSMCIRDPLDGSTSWEEGEREEWMDEMVDALLIVEIPEHVYDYENECFLTKFRPAKAVLQDGLLHEKDEQNDEKEEAGDAEEEGEGDEEAE